MIVQIGGNRVHMQVQSSGIGRASVVAREAAEAAVDLVQGEIAAAGAAQVELVEAAGAAGIEARDQAIAARDDAQAAQYDAEQARNAAQTAQGQAQAAVAACQEQVELAQAQVAAAAGQVALAEAQVALAEAQTALAAAQAVAAAQAAGAAEAAMSQAQLAALAAGAPIYVTLPTAPFTDVPSPFLYSTAAGVAVYTHDGSTATQVGFLGTVSFPNVAALKAFTGSLAPVGTRIFAGRFRYEVVSSGEHLTTDGSQKLIVLPGSDGYDLEAFGADLTGVAAVNTILGVANTAAVAADTPIVLQGGEVSLTASATVAADLTIKRGGKVKFGGGVVMTVEGCFTAGRYEVFTGSVGVSVGPSFASGSIDAILPEWFGAKSYKVAGGTPFDSSPGVLKAHQCAARGVIGFTYKMSFGQGIYGFGSGIDVPTGGDCVVVGQGTTNTQFRAIDSGSGFPDYIYKLISSTTNTRFRHIYWYGGSSSRPCKFGIYSEQMKHTHVTDCLFSSFSIAGVASSEWDNKFEDCEFEFCHVGIWCRRAGGNNNDITVDTCRFVSCEVGVVLNAGTSCRVRNGQFQASLIAPFTKTFIYAQGVSGLSVDNNYFETQATGGLAGMSFTSPEAITVYASIIFNGEPYFTDEVGTVTTTLSQSGAALGTVGSITDNLFATPSYYQAGAGGSGYTAGGVTFTALNGSGSGASGTVTVSGGIVTSATATTPGNTFQIGDLVSIVQGGNTTAIATVSATGANNGIAGLIIGGSAAVYPGHVRSLTMSNNLTGSSVAMVALYNDTTYCDARRLVISQEGKSSASYLDWQLIGSNITTQKARLGNIVSDNQSFRFAPGIAHGPQNYYPSTLAFTPSTSTLTRNGGRYQGFPYYRLTLNAAQKTSDPITGSLTIAASGASNAELCGRRVYLSALKSESAPNVKVRLTLSLTKDGNTVTVQNYDNGTTFTKAASTEREEVSIYVPISGGTLSWTIEVIAATAASQFADLSGFTLAPVGTALDTIPRHDYERNLVGSVSWDPASLADGATEKKEIPVIGARLGDAVTISAPGDIKGFALTGYVKSANLAEAVLNNESGVAENLGAGTYRASVEMLT